MTARLTLRSACLAVLLCAPASLFAQGTAADYARANGLRAAYEALTANVPGPATWIARALSGVGIMLGEADVNISAMHLARSRPREDALMILALDDDVPESVSDAIRAQDAVRDLWTIRLGSVR